MARRKKSPTLRERYDAFLAQSEPRACMIVGASVAAALVALFLFVVFSDFGASAEFIYNQF